MQTGAAGGHPLGRPVVKITALLVGIWGGLSERERRKLKKRAV